MHLYLRYGLILILSFIGVCHNQQDVLVDKYHFSKADAQFAASFISPLLQMDPAKRSTAQQMLQHPWVRDVDAQHSANNGTYVYCIVLYSMALVCVCRVDDMARSEL
jgi:serine/threonine protein kinase